MNSIRTTQTIAAPRQVVWNALADLGAVAVWNPCIADAECLSEQLTGVGARRVCHMDPSGSMTEVVTEWVEGERIVLTVEDASPFKSGVAVFELFDDPDDSTCTRLDASFEYQVRLGPLGPVIDRVFLHRQLNKNWNAGMDGLRDHAESSTASTNSPTDYSNTNTEGTTP